MKEFKNMDKRGKIFWYFVFSLLLLSVFYTMPLQPNILPFDYVTVTVALAGFSWIAASFVYQSKKKIKNYFWRAAKYYILSSISLIFYHAFAIYSTPLNNGQYLDRVQPYVIMISPYVKPVVIVIALTFFVLATYYILVSLDKFE